MYLYEMHTHTCEVSKCGTAGAAEQIRVYKNHGFSGVCITDHFLNGNTTVPAKADWKARVELFCRGWELACEEGDKLGIDVFFGWEYSYLGADFLTYGLDKSWLLENPDCVMWGLLQYCDEVHAAGGTIVHAHPFREAPYIEMLRLVPRHVDAVEALNANRTDFENSVAKQYAENYGLPLCAGTDNHIGETNRFCAMGFERRAENVRGLMTMLLNGEGRITDIRK